MSQPDFATWFRRQLTRRGLKPAELARRSGISSGRISEWPSGKQKPGPRSCERLAEALDADSDTVLAAAGHRQPAEPLRPDDPRARLLDLVKRVRLTDDRVVGLEGTLQAWLDQDRKRRAEIKARTGG